MPSVCTAAGCRKRPAFGMPGSSSRQRCAEHKGDGMVNLSARICVESGCTKLASFGDPEGRSRHCLAHKAEGEINNRKQLCKAPDCKTAASYGDPVTGRRSYCTRHKPSGSANIAWGPCRAPGCGLVATFGASGHARPQLCHIHAAPGMEMKIKSPYCEVPDCTSRRSFGPRGGEMIHCSAHKTAGEVIVDSRRCAAPGCVVVSHYGAPGTTRRLYCDRHKLTGMVCLTVSGAKKAGPKRKAGEEPLDAELSPEKRANTAADV